MLTPQDIDKRLERVLPTVQKPGRYTGGEYNQVIKDWNAISSHVALVFPDIYDLGMSNLGLAILYDIVNRQPDALAERAYLPWEDMDKVMRAAGIPLYALESHRPLADFDIIGISLPYESLYTNALHILHLAGIPLRAAERSRHPLIIAGGQATFNPEPMSAFIDAFAIGEGEEVILEIIEAERSARQRGAAREELLHNLARIPGVYVPKLYEAEYEQDGTFRRLMRLTEDASLPVIKRFVPRLPPPPTKFIVPYIETVHNRIPIEIMRGCTRGCRFCHAGMVNRPVRERPVAEIVQAVEAAVAATGYEEVGLLSLSSSDYSHILELVQAINQRFGDKGSSAGKQRLTVSLPSLRIETFSVDLVEALAGSRKHGGFTLAPEAATERMRQIINKPVSPDQLLETARTVYACGFPTLKLYFMIGHPSETLEDVRSIADLCKAVLAVGRNALGRRAEVHAGVSTFVPKPHTPFQWTPCDTTEQILAKQAILKSELRTRGIKLTWTKPEETMLEAWLSRGDRRMAEVIYAAWQRGAIFDAWQDRFNYPAWVEAFAASELDPAFYTHRPRTAQEAFPWDHIHAGVRKKYLLQDYQWSQENRTRPDCREQCFGCGILPLFVEARRNFPGDWWKCPEVRPRAAQADSPSAVGKMGA